MANPNAQSYRLLIAILSSPNVPRLIHSVTSLIGDPKNLVDSRFRGNDKTICFGFNSEIDWDFILDKAVQEGVFYPFYRNLLLLGINKKFIPEDLSERFRQMYYLHIFKSTDFSFRIEKVLNCMESFKIKTLLFKGPAVDYFIYDNFFRPRIDLDIVVEDGQMLALEKALFDLGYGVSEEEKNYPLPEYLNSRLFIPRSDGLVPVHIHKHLINNMFLTVDRVLSMEMKDVWKETEFFRNYRYLYMLKPELNIVYLCEHGLKHDFDQIIFLYEIATLLCSYQEGLDWKKLGELSEDFGLGRAVYYGLYFVKEVLSVDVPGEVLDRLKPGKISFGEKIFIKNTLIRNNRRYASYPVYLAMRRGLSKKANFIFRTLFPPEFTFKGCLNRMRRLVSG